MKTKKMHWQCGQTVLLGQMQTMQCASRPPSHNSSNRTAARSSTASTNPCPVAFTQQLPDMAAPLRFKRIFCDENCICWTLLKPIF